MKILSLHPWKLSIPQAIALQKRLARRVAARNRPGTIRFVAGADIAFRKDSSDAVAGVVVMRYPSLEIVERARARVKITFPYVPGLLAFREAPALIQAFSRLKTEPDLILIDGQGTAHPRRFGIACHMGLLLNIPTVGCAKSRLYGRHREPGARPGSWSELYDPVGRVIGAAVRTKRNTRPIYVSVGHRIGLETAIRLVLSCGGGYRIPEPTRQADLYVERLKNPDRTARRAPRSRAAKPSKNLLTTPIYIP